MSIDEIEQPQGQRGYGGPVAPVNEPRVAQRRPMIDEEGPVTFLAELAGRAEFVRLDERQAVRVEDVIAVIELRPKLDGIEQTKTMVHLRGPRPLQVMVDAPIAEVLAKLEGQNR